MLGPHTIHTTNVYLLRLKFRGEFKMVHLQIS